MTAGRLDKIGRRTPPRLKHLLIRICNRVVRALDTAPAPSPADATHNDAPPGESPPAPPVPDDTEPVWKSAPVPVPDGLTLDEIEAMFRTWSVNGAPAGHLDVYLDDSLWRFCYTWSMIRDEQGRCLELGANPYFTTQLLDDYTALDLTLVNFYGERGEQTETVSYVRPKARERIVRQHDTLMFNVEEDEFPFPAGSFDVVLFCETIEHLLMDPVAALREIHRVLKPGGILVLTTPNVARLDNAAAMVDGRNIYDPYSGFGPYGRHNREYTLHDLYRVLEFVGFDVDISFTADGHAPYPERRVRYAQVEPLLLWRSLDLGQYLFVRARAVDAVHEGRPSFLYRDRGDGTIVEYE
jgi:SAM-dependent methyltransferase